MMKAATVEMVVKIMEQHGGDEGSGLHGSKIGGDDKCVGGSDSEGNNALVVEACKWCGSREPLTV